MVQIVYSGIFRGVHDRVYHLCGFQTGKFARSSRSKVEVPCYPVITKSPKRNVRTRSFLDVLPCAYIRQCTVLDKLRKRKLLKPHRAQLLGQKPGTCGIGSPWFLGVRKCFVRNGAVLLQEPVGEHLERVRIILIQVYGNVPACLAFVIEIKGSPIKYLFANFEKPCSIARTYFDLKWGLQNKRSASSSVFASCV